jgi:acetyl-CoA synthetase
MIRTAPPEPFGDPSEQDEAWRGFARSVRENPSIPFDEQWERFEEIFRRRKPDDPPPAAWTPSPEEIRASNLGRFMTELALPPDDYRELHAWSCRNRSEFWQRVVRRLGIVFKREPGDTLDLSSGVEEPAWLPGAELNCVDSCFQTDSTETVIISGSESSPELETVSLGDLRRMMDRVARGLHDHGFSPGDAVALYMPMTVECVAAYLGIIHAGCSVISIAESFAPDEVKKRLEIGNASAVITCDAFTRAGKTIQLYEKIRQAGAPRAIVIPSTPKTALDLHHGDMSWDEFLGSDEERNSHPGDPDTIINILFSSGTTGTPKAIPWTHLTPLKCAMDGHFHQDIRPGDVVCWPTGIGWMMGPWLVFAALVNRAAIALFQGAPTSEAFTRFVEKAGVTMLGLVPSLVRAWRSSGAADSADWSNVRVFSSTGEPSNREDYLWLMSRTGYRAPVIEYCGGTEIGGGYITGTVVQSASPATFTTPALGLDFAILDEEAHPVSGNAAGEVFLIPPSIGLSQKLLNADHHDVYYAGCPTGPDGEVLRRHGDHIERLPGGYYKARGRTDDTMNLGGIKVSSLELEQVLDEHEDVYESAAVAVRPGGEGADRLVVFAVTAGGVEPDRLRQELGTLIAKHLNPLFKIHDLVLTDRLPRTASNKVMRRLLRDRYDNGG